MNGEVSIREARQREVGGWDALVARFANHRAMHTAGWLRSLEDSNKGRALFLVFERDGDIVGLLPGLLTRIGPLRIFGSPLPGWQTRSMGPVFDVGKISTGEMVPLAIEYLEKVYKVHHIEIMSRSLDAVAMRAERFLIEPKPTYSVELFPGEEDRALSGMKQNARNKIKRAIKSGLAVRQIDDESFADEVHDQLIEVYGRGGNAIPYGRNRVVNLFRQMRDNGTLVALGAYLPEGKCIATGLFLAANRELILWSWSHRTAYRNHNPTELMVWEAMRLGMELGCTSMRLGGGGDYKAKFGAKLETEKYRMVRSRYPWMIGARELAEKCYRWQQSLRGRMSRRKHSSECKL